MATKDSVCARCAKRKKGTTDCCTDPFPRGFYLTVFDIARIIKATGLSPYSFVRLNSVDQVHLGEHPDDYYKPLHIKGHWLGMKGETACPFLSDKGCTIFEDRPMLCRIHPFWFEIVRGRTRLRVEADDSCLSHRLSGGKKEKMLESLGETEAHLLKVIEQYLHEISSHREIMGQNEGTPLPKILLKEKLL